MECFLVAIAYLWKLHELIVSPHICYLPREKLFCGVGVGVKTLSRVEIFKTFFRIKIIKFKVQKNYHTEKLIFTCPNPRTVPTPTLLLMAHHFDFANPIFIIRHFHS
jgi:hypothetical protein